MDLSCIISSGDLELYILGMLPEDEASKIEQLAKLFPEVQEELDRIAESLKDFAEAASPSPSPAAKQGLMSKLRELKAEENENEARVVALPHQEQQSIEDTPVRALNPTQRVFPVWAAASLIGFVLSVGVLLFLVSQNKKNRSELVSVQEEVRALQKKYTQQQQEMVAYNQTLQMMQNSDYKKVTLTNLPGKETAQAQVMWNTKTYEVYLSDVSLPAPPTGKQYQLWAIVDGKPVDAGLMSDVKHVAQKMKTFKNADAFAISIENKGGSPTPTEVYMMGKV